MIVPSLTLSHSQRKQRIVALLIISLLLAVTTPGAAVCAEGATTKEGKKASQPAYKPNLMPPPAHPARVRRGPAAVTLFKPKLQFSKSPTDDELSRARVFTEPLIPMTKKPIAGENLALKNAILAFKKKKDLEDVSDLTGFMAAYPKSRWQPSLELNLGMRRYETGHLGDALTLWKSAWDSAKTEKGRLQKAVADSAIGELLLLESRLGLEDELQKNLSEIAKRPVYGSVEDEVKSARYGLWMMQHQPGVAFKCGPFALNSLLYLDKPVPGQHPLLKAARSSKRGTNLAQVKELADEVGLRLQMAKRSKGAPFLIPCVTHWKVGHFAAITAYKQGRYQIKDPTFGTGGMIWVTPSALESETDGYFLVPDGDLPSGWSQVGASEAQSVWGKGVAQGRDPANASSNKNNPGNGCNGGMAQAAVYSMQATLNIFDQPVGYNPPVGPSMGFRVNYNYLEAGQPASFTFTNFGADWSLNWIAYLTVDASNNATVRVPGGGIEIYNYVQPDNINNPYAPNLTSQAVLAVVGSGTYQRQLPDGSIEVYNQPDGTGRIFMTQLIDPQGNSAFVQYDSNFRVTSITDALGQVTAFTYVSNSSGNVGFYKVASISDPFLRQATFAYDSTTSYLASITDVIGLQSSFTVDSSTSAINAMTTPYGTTSFYQYTPANSQPPAQGLRFGFPDGSSAVLENWIGETKQTYYWDREAMQMYPTDPGNQLHNHCTTTKWLYNAATGNESAVVNYVQPPLESQITYITPGETGQDFQGTSNLPIQIYRSLNGNSTTFATIGGTVTTGDTLTITVSDSTLPSPGQESVSYKVSAGDTLSKIASGLASAINADPNLQAISVSATTSGSVVVINSGSTGNTTYAASTNSGATETIVLTINVNGPMTATIGGTVTSADILNIIVSDQGLSGGKETVSYRVNVGDTLNSIAAGLAAATNADTKLQAIGVTASASSAVVTITSNSINATTYSQSTSMGATETIVLAPASNSNVQTYNYQYNSFGHVTQSIDPRGRTFSYKYSANNVDLLEKRQTQGTSNDLLGKWEYSNNQHVPSLYIDGSGQKTQYAYNNQGQLAVLTDANLNSTKLSYSGAQYLTIGGTKTTLDKLTLTVYNAGLSGGQTTITYTVGPIHTSPTATNFAAAINGALTGTGVSALVVQDVGGATGTIALNSGSIYPTTYRVSISAGATERLAVGPTGKQMATAVIGGSKQTSDVLTLTFLDPNLTGGQEAVNYTVQSSDTLTTIASNMAAAINADSNLQAISVSATSVSTGIIINSFSVNVTGYLKSTSTGATETIALRANSNTVQTQNVLVGGSVTTGDSLSVSVR
jgi:YD repeat-containing protein